MSTDRKLSIMIFPQEWTLSGLTVNLLLLPSGDPTVAPAPAEQSFAHNPLPGLRARFLPLSASVPPWDAPDGAGDILPVHLQPAPHKVAIFDALASSYHPTTSTLRTATSGRIRKDLPPSYLSATGFRAADPTSFTSGDGFGCDLRGTRPSLTGSLPSRMQWGEILSYALRQPILSRAMGLSYTNIKIPLEAVAAAEGGWLWIEIDTSNPSHWLAGLVAASSGAAPGTQPVRSYAARLPFLTAPQSIFSAVLFPVNTPQTGLSATLDQAQFEADLYTDGFMRVVHLDQPTTADAAVGNDPTLPPGTDAGIQIGWDDEQVATWIQRQVSSAQQMAHPVAGTTPAEIPMAVQGYRVDVRRHTAPHATADAWHSLTLVESTLTIEGVDLADSRAQIGGDLSSSRGDHATSLKQELAVEPTPVGNGAAPSSFWLPRYFAQWRGRSLVVNDKYAYAFSGGTPPKTFPSPTGMSGATQEVPPSLHLRYGRSYDFRVRLSDLTGGGPLLSDTSSSAGTATIPFVRHVPPKAVVFPDFDKGEISVTPVSRDKALTTLRVDRPRVTYPEIAFAGAATEAQLDAALADLETRRAEALSLPQVSFPDPAADVLEIIVEARMPAHDTGHLATLRDSANSPNPNDVDGNFRVVSRVSIPFPAFDAGADPTAFHGVTLTFKPVDLAQISNIGTLPAPTGDTLTIPVPTARDLRVRLRALGSNDLTYWGSTAAATGLVRDLRLRYEAAVETAFLKDYDPNAETHPASAFQLEAFYLRLDPDAAKHAITANAVLDSADQLGIPPGAQLALAQSLQAPDPTPLERLASSLNLQVNGQTLAGAPGRRVLFGAQSTLRHTLTQDRSSVTFGSQHDLLGHWIVAIRFTIDRDWTWDGLVQGTADGALRFFSQSADTTKPLPPLPSATPMPGSSPTEIGRIDIPSVVSALSTVDIGDPAQRDEIDVVFFATVDTTPQGTDFPTVTNLAFYSVARFTNHASTDVTIWQAPLSLPITLSPTDIPKVASAGIAESPFESDALYTSTQQRKRTLWFEFDAPPLNPRDAFFLRVLAYGPDPLLISALPRNEILTGIPPVKDPDLPIDPEPIRRISSGAVNDDAGLGAMTQVVAAADPLNSAGQAVHYRVPLPDALTDTSLELFGFYTVELRVGHLDWSTAQARFGRPLRLAGVQHPAPPLAIGVERQQPVSHAPESSDIFASANLAQTVYQGRSLTVAAHPQTEIWFILYAQARRADGLAWRNILLAKKRGITITSTNNAAGALLSDAERVAQSAASKRATASSALFPVGTRAARAVAAATARTQWTQAIRQSLTGTELSASNLVKLGPIFSPVVTGAGFPTEVIDPANNTIPVNAVFSGKEVASVLTGLGLSLTSTVSVLAVELFNEEAAVLGNDFNRSAAFKQAPASSAGDPLGADLGSRRILRVSPLTAVRNVC